MARVRARVRVLTPRGAVSRRTSAVVIADVNPVLRGWGQYFRTGNAADNFTDVDRYVERAAPWVALQARGGSRWPAG